MLLRVFVILLAVSSMGTAASPRQSIDGPAQWDAILNESRGRLEAGESKPARRMSRSSNENPNGFTRCSRTPVLAQSRMMLPVLCGISGSNNTMCSSIHFLRIRERIEPMMQFDPPAVTLPVAQRETRAAAHLYRV